MDAPQGVAAATVASDTSLVPGCHALWCPAPIPQSVRLRWWVDRHGVCSTLGPDSQREDRSQRGHVLRVPRAPRPRPPRLSRVEATHGGNVPQCRPRFRASPRAGVTGGAPGPFGRPVEVPASGSAGRGLSPRGRGPLSRRGGPLLDAPTSRPSRPGVAPPALSTGEGMTVTGPRSATTCPSRTPSAQRRVGEQSDSQVPPFLSPRAAQRWRRRTSGARKGNFPGEGSDVGGRDLGRVGGSRSSSRGHEKDAHTRSRSAKWGFPGFKCDLLPLSWVTRPRNATL